MKDAALEYSVVIPAYNATLYLPETLESVFAQTLLPTRVIVVDDGSTDDLAACIAPFDVILIRQENAGPGAATTRGMAAVTTPFVATLDADDLWLPEKMAQQIALLAAEPTLDGVFAPLIPFGESLGEKRADIEKSGWSRSTMTLRTPIFTRVGPMIDPPGRRGEMIDWIDRARLAGVALRLTDTPLAKRRLHPGSLTFSRSPDSIRAYMEVARAAIARRKAGIKHEL